MVVAGLFTPDTPLILIVVIALLNGIGRSVGLTCYSTIGFSEMPAELLRDANTLQATAQQLSVGLGVPLAAVALRAGGPLGRLLPGSVGPGSAYTVAFVLLAAVALIATARALRLHPDAGSQVTKRSSPERPAVPG